MKKNIFLLLLFLFCILSPVFSQSVLSLNIIFAEQDAVLVPEIEGELIIDDSDSSLLIKKTGDNFYSLQYGNRNNASLFEAVFTKIGKELILDLQPVLPDTIGDRYYRNQFIISHSFYKINFKKNTLFFSELNYAWFYNFMKKNSSFAEYSFIDNGLLLTMTTAELKTFFTEHINEPVFFNSYFVAKRKSGMAIKPTQKPVAVNDNILNTENAWQKCIPEFPLKDGWLGGDEDVSVPINEVQSLFLFSDTYVGMKNDNRQSSGYIMVPNTVAVTNCMPDGRFDIQYYWRKMYSNRPEPIFNSFTNRYKYWLADAFMYKNNLFVLMQKVEPKKDGAPNDIFNFSQIGFTLAKVANPISTTPDQWDIQLIPMSYFDPYFSNARALVKDGGYIYFFVDKNFIATQLLRLNLDFIDNPENHFEYYSLLHTWKPGINPADMETILKKNGGNSIHYHADIKKWVMVCGPNFIEGKIFLRTANELTGPWSDEDLVYECPEATPGTSSYDKSGYTYLGSECFQYYDKINQNMIITYNWNADFLKIKMNPKIYTPRVISISLKKYGSR